MSLTNGWRGLCLAEVALSASQATLHDQATHHAGLDLLKVVRLSTDLCLQEADVRLIPSLLLREERGKRDGSPHPKLFGTQMLCLLKDLFTPVKNVSLINDNK